MAKARSPQYPSIGLKEAIDKAESIWKEDYQNPIPRELASRHMGYTGLNGKSLGVLSALLKFGLLEGRGDDTRVSDLAVKIIAHQPGTGERIEAIRQAAVKPELFNELDGRFQNGKASDAAIRSYLITQKFIPAGADAAIRAYRETKQLVDAESRGYIDISAEQEVQMQPEPSSVAQVNPPASSAPTVTSFGDGPSAGMRRVVFDLAEGDVVLQFPEELSPESVGDLEDYLEVFMKKARRAAGLPPKSGSGT